MKFESENCKDHGHAVNYAKLKDDREDNDKQQDAPSDVVLPSLLLVHGALILAQTLFGTGSIIGKLGLPATNPVLFALIREGIAGPLLCVIAYCKDKAVPKFADLKLFILPGFCLFFNQFCFIVGLKISSSIIASAWQPSQGVLAVLYGYCFRIEHGFDRYKIGGILISTAGALFMILFDNHEDSGHKDFFSAFGGSIMFFLNCSGTVFYLILGKPLFRKYPPTTITGYSYMVASLSMVVAALVVANVPALLDGVCPDCHGEAWNVPTVTIYALIYWILAESVATYLLITWANQYTDPSVNLAYTVLQPFVAVLCAEILIIFRVVPRCHLDGRNNADDCIYGANWNDLGAIGIAIGLWLVIYSQRLKQQRLKQEQEAMENGSRAINDPSMKSAAYKSSNAD